MEMDSSFRMSSSFLTRAETEAALNSEFLITERRPSPRRGCGPGGWGFCAGIEEFYFDEAVHCSRDGVAPRRVFFSRALDQVDSASESAKISSIEDRRRPRGQKSICGSSQRSSLEKRRRGSQQYAASGAAPRVRELYQANSLYEFKKNHHDNMRETSLICGGNSSGRVHFPAFCIVAYRIHQLGLWVLSAPGRSRAF